jgi:hypothetical protein
MRQLRSLDATAKTSDHPKGALLEVSLQRPQNATGSRMVYPPRDHQGRLSLNSNERING